MGLKKVKVVQDESSHWYVIPVELYQNFKSLVEKSVYDNDIGYDAQEEFEEKFEKYRTNGDVNKVQLWAEV